MTTVLNFYIIIQKHFKTELIILTTNP